MKAKTKERNKLKQNHFKDFDFALVILSWKFIQRYLFFISIALLYSTSTHHQIYGIVFFLWMHRIILCESATFNTDRNCSRKRKQKSRQIFFKSNLKNDFFCIFIIPYWVWINKRNDVTELRVGANRFTRDYILRPLSNIVKNKA